MSAYRYVGRSPQGSRVKGVIEADTARGARIKLREQGIFVEKLVESQAAQERTSQARFWRNPMKGSELSLFTRQLSTLVDAGMPLDEALATVAAQSEKATTKSLVLSIRAKLLEGHSLAAALAVAPKSFNTLYRALIRAGESSGLLGQVLEQLADYLENRMDTQQKLKSAMAYPIVLMVVSLGIVVFLMTSVVPEIVSVFQKSNQALPALTEIVIAMSDYLVSYGLLTLIVLVGLGIAIKRWLNRSTIKPVYHAKLLHMPVVGPLIRSIEGTRFASTMSILVGSGVNLVDGLRIAGEVMGNLEMQRANQRVTEQVIAGSSLFKALNDSKSYPLLLVHMVGSGERSGDLAPMLDRAATHQERELSGKLAAAMTLIEPAMILIMGGVVLAIVMSVLMPMLEMNNMVKL
ncbi:type II secretion system inner membrane protein GspF [uncultured Umboniibacter sp.]|uniref:type II secretion system inner membrane protein GspF n=1 Tax=uncultured Umboniibacter sp. TaxID=1798917 RepID=UPI0026081F46|nr:type II secretion system inner membrane protein GspF [uncultured Umboniibacter sp.]